MNSKPKGISSQAQHQTLQPNNNSSTWACKRCTFSNLVDLNSCEVCEAPRSPNIPLTLPRKPIIVSYGTTDLDSDNKYVLKQKLMLTSPNLTKKNILYLSQPFKGTSHKRPQERYCGR